MNENCEELLKAYRDAFNADGFADRALEIAIDTQENAVLAEGAAVASIEACVLTVEFPPALAVCLAITIAAGIVADNALDTANDALILAQDMADAAQGDMNEALQNWCDCVGH